MVNKKIRIGIKGYGLALYEGKDMLAEVYDWKIVNFLTDEERSNVMHRSLMKGSAETQELAERHERIIKKWETIKNGKEIN